MALPVASSHDSRNYLAVRIESPRRSATCLGSQLEKIRQAIHTGLQLRLALFLCVLYTLLPRSPHHRRSVGLPTCSAMVCYSP